MLLGNRKPKALGSIPAPTDSAKLPQIADRKTPKGNNAAG